MKVHKTPGICGVPMVRLSQSGVQECTLTSDMLHAGDGGLCDFPKELYCPVKLRL